MGRLFWHGTMDFDLSMSEHDVMIIQQLSAFAVNYQAVVSMISMRTLDHSISSIWSMNPPLAAVASTWLAFGWLQSSHAISLPASLRTRTN